MSSRFASAALVEGPKERPGQEGGKRAENRRKRIDALCEAGLTLFLARGIEPVTVEEIAREAGMAKGNLYRYFQGKEALVEAMFQPLREGFHEALEGCEEALRAADEETDLFAAYEAMGEALTALMLPYLDLVHLYLQESRAPASGARKTIRALADEILERATRLTEIAHSRGLLQAASPQVSTLVVLGAIERLLFAFIQGDLVLPPDEVTQTLISIVLDGVRRSPPSP